MRCPPPASPILRGLGRRLWQKKIDDSRLHAARGGRALSSSSMRSRRAIAPNRACCWKRAKTCSCAPRPTRTATERANLDPEAVTSQIQVCCRAISRATSSRRKSSTKIRNSIRRSAACVDAHAARPVRHWPRLRARLSQEERTLEAYYDRLNVYAVEKSRVIAVDFSSANPELAAQRRQYDRRDLSQHCSSRPRQDQTRAAGNWLAGEIEKMRTQGRRRRSQGRGISRASPICSSAPTIRRCRTSSLPRSIRRSRRRAARRPISRRGRGNCANWCAPASRSIPPTSPIPRSMRR